MRSIVLVATIAIFSSCNSADSQPETDPSLKVTNQVTESSITDPASAIQAVSDTQQSMPAATVQPVVSTAPGMNPPHGQPGHRCDIEVGKPLNSAPATKTTTQAITSTPAAAVQQVKTAPGMNPPHGQPGHRCDIEVGKPLNSAPKTTAVSTPATTTVQPVVTAPVVENVKKDSAN